MKKVIGLLTTAILTQYPMYSQTLIKPMIQKNKAGIVNKAYFVSDDQDVKTPTSASEFFQTYLNLSSDDSFEKHTLKSHDKQTCHEIYEQLYKGIKVAGGSYVFHYKNGKMTRARGEYLPIKKMDTTPSITKEEAALAFAKHKGILKEKILDFSSELIILYPPNQNADKKGNDPALAYKIYLQTNGIENEEFGFIDAHNGNLITTTKGYDSFTTYGLLETIYSGDEYAHTCYYNGEFHLVDSTRGAIIHTWDLQGNTNPYYAIDLTDNDNYWEKNEHAINRKYVAHDVQWALQEIYDALYYYYSRCSYDDNGAIINAYINYDGVDNAYWSFYHHSIYVAKDTSSYRPMASLDIISHEFGHGITSYNIGWDNPNYLSSLNDNERKEVHGLNEGMSDIWAVILKYIIRNNTNGIWQIGADVVPGVKCLRNIQYPNIYSVSHIATAYGDPFYTNEYSHARGGVFSRWFYLLAMGGSGTNTIGQYYNVQGIGLDSAADLVVNAVYEGELYHTRSFQEVRDAFMDIAIESGNTNLINNVANAWYAVGVGDMNLSISGQNIISSQGIYSLDGLPSGFSVLWSLSDSYYNQNCLQQATPSDYQCTIVRNSNQEMSNATLTATVKHNGVTVQTLTKSGLYAYAGFKGTYSSSFGSGQYNAPNPIFTAANSIVQINSPNLINATTTYNSGATIPSIWLIGNDYLYIGTPSSGSTIVVHVICENGDDYYIPIILTDHPYYISVSFNGDMMNVTLDKCKTVNTTWTIEVFNTLTGKKIIQQEVIGESVSLDTKGWNRGIYVARVSVGKDVLTEKIQIR